MKRISIGKHDTIRLGLGLLLTAAAACGDDDPSRPPEGAGDLEFISRVTVTLTPQNGGAPIVATINDPDASGPQAPSAPSAPLTLAKGTTYNGRIELFNAVEPNNVLPITPEVIAEKNEHRFFYTVTGLTGVTVDNRDLDDNGFTFGQTFRVTVAPTAPSGTGTMNIVLSHYDDEPKTAAETPSDETDIDLDFTVVVP